MLGVVFYSVFLLTGQFEHHELIGHTNTPFHCTACASSVLGSDPHTPTVFDGSHLADAGRALTSQPVVQGVLLPAHSTGRSPPTA